MHTDRFLYFYLMDGSPDRVMAAAPRHAEYWRELNAPSYRGGPFGDRSGGLITFEAGSETEATAFVAGDPFLQEDLLERYWLKEWVVD